MKKLIAFIISILSLLVVGCGAAEDGINTDPEFYEYDEMVDLFLNNSEDFQKVADIIIDSEKLVTSMQENNMTYYTVSQKWQNRYFKESDWEVICFFLNKTDLEGFTRYDTSKNAGNGTIRFNAKWKRNFGFFSNKIHIVSIYYSNINNLPKSESRDYKKIKGFYGWYIYEEII